MTPAKNTYGDDVVCFFTSDVRGTGVLNATTFEACMFQGDMK
jgi:hypothetical protein